MEEAAGLEPAQLAAAGMSPRGILAAVRRRVEDARYAAEDLGYVAGRLVRRRPRPAAAAEGLRDRLPPRARTLLVAGVAGVAAIAALFAFTGQHLPCEVPGGDSCPPPDNAAALVPAAALAYVHLDLDPGRHQVVRLGEVAGRVPKLAEQLLGRSAELVPGVELTFTELAVELAPWLGDEAALALLPAGGGATHRLWLLAVDDPVGARDFAGELTGRANVAEHRGIEIEADGSGELAAAQVSGFLAVGSEQAVRAVIDVGAREGSASLGDDPAMVEIRDELPPERAAEAYLSGEGAEELIAEAPGALSALAPFALPEATRGVGIALGAGEEGELELAVRSLLDSGRVEAEPGFFGALDPFEPELPQRFPDDSLAYVGFGDPGRAIGDLLARAGAGEAGQAGGFEGFAAELGGAGGIDLEDGLLPALGAEAAFVIEPRAAGGDDLLAATPFLEFVASGVDADAAREALTALEAPAVAAIAPVVGARVPEFGPIEVAGVEAQSSRVSPAIELTHAIVDDLAVIATDPLGIERLAEGSGGLDGAEMFERATADFADEVSLLAFLDLRQLVAAAERLGLAEDPVYAAFSGEVRSLLALGIAVRRTSELLATDARLIVEPRDAETPLAPPEPELPRELDEGSELEPPTEIEPPDLELPGLP